MEERKMKLYLVQHGNAAVKEVDPDRGLTERGKDDVGKVADFIRSLNISAQLWHSGKTRAAQTAEMLAKAMTVKCVVSGKEGLSPNDDVKKTKEQIESVDEDVMIVGHLPFLGKLVSLFVTGDESKGTIAFKQGCMVCLECGEEKLCHVEWMVIPEILV